MDVSHVLLFAHLALHPLPDHHVMPWAHARHTQKGVACLTPGVHLLVQTEHTGAKATLTDIDEALTSELNGRNVDN